jgi:hypothetical protein
VQVYLFWFVPREARFPAHAALAGEGGDGPPDPASELSLWEDRTRYDKRLNWQASARHKTAAPAAAPAAGPAAAPAAGPAAAGAAPAKLAGTLRLSARRGQVTFRQPSIVLPADHRAAEEPVVPSRPARRRAAVAAP